MSSTDILSNKLPHFLTEVHLQGIRGIGDLRVVFDYPVSVIAGGNASGKSTVLFAAACAYKVPGAGVKDFVPSAWLPDWKPDARRATFSPWWKGCRALYCNGGQSSSLSPAHAGRKCFQLSRQLVL